MAICEPGMWGARNGWPGCWRTTSCTRRSPSAPAGDECVCARHGTDRAGWKSPCQVFAEPKARRRARASPRGGVWRKPNPRARGDVQEPDSRCGTPGTSGHVTAKSSIRTGVCFINPASTRGTICVLPWEISRLSERTGWRATGTDRPGEVSRGRSSPVAGEAMEAPQCRKAGQQIGRAATARDEGPNGAPRGA
jgi:hypothetical protein